MEKKEGGGGGEKGGGWVWWRGRRWRERRGVSVVEGEGRRVGVVERRKGGRCGREEGRGWV